MLHKKADYTVSVYGHMCRGSPPFFQWYTLSWECIVIADRLLWAFGRGEKSVKGGLNSFSFFFFFLQISLPAYDVITLPSAVGREGKQHYVTRNTSLRRICCGHPLACILTGAVRTYPSLLRHGPNGPSYVHLDHEIAGIVCVVLPIIYGTA
jgi:hypothetical protein